MSPWTIASGSFILGVLAWGAFNTALELTNTETFCISCHEMKKYVYREYTKTIHYTNRTGVRATCPDCHVPRRWEFKVIRKIAATNELFHHLLGSIDTPEKFGDKRLALAKKVWTTMERTDSRECRNCHAARSMDLDVQRDVARERHRSAQAQGKTCIDCHKGIAHSLPEAFLEQEHARFQRDGTPCWDCHRDMPRPPADDDWDEP